MAVNRGIDRRTFVTGAGALGLLGATGGLGSFLAGCGGDDEAAVTTAAEAAEAVRGGRAVLATVDKPVNMDPATPSSTRRCRSTRTSSTSSSTSTPTGQFIPGLARSLEAGRRQDLDSSTSSTTPSSTTASRSRPRTSASPSTALDARTSAMRDLRAGVEGDGGGRRPHRCASISPSRSGRSWRRCAGDARS